MKKLTLLLLMLPVFAISQIPDPIPNSYVNDLTGALTAQEIKSLNDTIFSIEKSTSVQIAIVIIDELPADMPIEDYAREVGRKWHVGNAHNGLVYVAALKQRKQRLEVAEELEGDIPDVVALQITDELKSFFKKGEYNQGLQQLLTSIKQRIDPVAKEQQKLAEVEQQKKDKKETKAVLNVFLWLLGLGVAGTSIYFFFIYPGITRRRQKKEAEAEEERQKLLEKIKNSRAANTSHVSPPISQKSNTTSGSSSSNRTGDESFGSSWTRESSSDSSSGSSWSSGSSSSDSSSDNNYGNWGSGSSDSGSSDSGYSGGGSSNDW